MPEQAMKLYFDCCNHSETLNIQQIDTCWINLRFDMLLIKLLKNSNDSLPSNFSHFKGFSMLELEGKKAPDFCLAGSDGREHCLKDYAGKTVVIYFYPRDNTPGCTKEACSFRDLHAEIQNLEASLFGVSQDSLASHDNFIRKFGLPFILLSDPDTDMMKKYAAFGEKLSFGKKTMGVIRSTVIIGGNGKVIKHWKTVKKAESHPLDVLEFLRQL